MILFDIYLHSSSLANVIVQFFTVVIRTSNLVELLG